MRGGFIDLIKSLYDIEGIGVSELFNSDIVRNPIIGKILSRLDQTENESSKQ
jgi:phosphate starvation-inducible protein PhoH